MGECAREVKVKMKKMVHIQAGLIVIGFESIDSIKYFESIPHFTAEKNYKNQVVDLSHTAKCRHRVII